MNLQIGTAKPFFLRHVQRLVRLVLIAVITASPVMGEWLSTSINRKNEVVRVCLRQQALSLKSIGALLARWSESRVRVIQSITAKKWLPTGKADLAELSIRRKVSLSPVEVTKDQMRKLKNRYDIVLGVATFSGRTIHSSQLEPAKEAIRNELRQYLGQGKRVLVVSRPTQLSEVDTLYDVCDEPEFHGRTDTMGISAVVALVGSESATFSEFISHLLVIGGGQQASDQMKQVLSMKKRVTIIEGVLDSQGVAGIPELQIHDAAIPERNLVDFRSLPETTDIQKPLPKTVRWGNLERSPWELVRKGVKWTTALIVLYYGKEVYLLTSVYSGSATLMAIVVWAVWLSTSPNYLYRGVLGTNVVRLNAKNFVQDLSSVLNTQWNDLSSSENKLLAVIFYKAFQAVSPIQNFNDSIFHAMSWPQTHAQFYRIRQVHGESSIKTWSENLLEVVCGYRTVYRVRCPSDFNLWPDRAPGHDMDHGNKGEMPVLRLFQKALWRYVYKVQYAPDDVRSIDWRVLNAREKAKYHQMDEFLQNAVDAALRIIRRMRGKSFLERNAYVGELLVEIHHLAEQHFGQKINGPILKGVPAAA